MDHTNQVNAVLVKAEPESIHDSLDDRVEFLLNRVFSRLDKVAIWNPQTHRPLPVRPVDEIKSIRAHVYGKKAPPATFVDIYGRSHIGHFRIGAYTPTENGDTIYGLFDLDGGGSGHKRPLKNPLAAAIELKNRAQTFGIPLHLEVSGSGTGYHLWLFLADLTSAAIVRNLLFTIANGTQFELFDGSNADPKRGLGIEVFPKQDRVKTGGFGNFVWAPFFHGSRNKCCQFIDPMTDMSFTLSVSRLQTIKPDLIIPLKYSNSSTQPKYKEKIVRRIEPTLKEGLGYMPLSDL